MRGWRPEFWNTGRGWPGGPHRRQGRGRGGTLGRPEPRSREGRCAGPAVSHQVQSRPRHVTPQRPSPPCVTPKLPGLQEVALSRKRSLQTAPAESRPESVAAVLVRRECGRRQTHGGHPVETEAETRRPGCLDPTAPPGLPGHPPHGRHDLDSALQPWAPPRSSGSSSGRLPARNEWVSTCGTWRKGMPLGRERPPPHPATRSARGVGEPLPSGRRARPQRQTPPARCRVLTSEPTAAAGGCPARRCSRGREPAGGTSGDGRFPVSLGVVTHKHICLSKLIALTVRNVHLNKGGLQDR